jgi:hypothetical protein
MPHPLDDCRSRIVAGLFELRVTQERSARLLARMESACAEFCDLLDMERSELLGDSEMLDE